MARICPPEDKAPRVPGWFSLLTGGGISVSPKGLELYGFFEGQ